MEKFNVSEVIFTSSNTIIERATRNDGVDVIIKKPHHTFPSQALVESYKKDFSFTKSFHDTNPEYFINMLDIIEQKNGSVVLIQEDVGSGLETLLQKKKLFTTKEFLILARDMTKSLDLVHSKQVIHRDIKVSNFVFDEKNQKPKLIDFGLAVYVSRKSPSISCSKPIGTFHYMSPEQTGRISKNVDNRSDIYSLGISFYELLTGKKPFEGDKLALVHSQITKKLPNIPDIPKVLNDLIQKMCSKNPSERYSSTKGILKDLEFIEKNLNSIPSNLEVGKQDEKFFQIPNKLYGREKEIRILKLSISSQEKMCLVSGYSGAGKSKLVEELFKEKTLELYHGYGKFDQFNRSTPFSAFIRFYSLNLYLTVFKCYEIFDWNYGFRRS